MKMLLDNWIAVGQSTKEFKDLLKEIDEKTKYDLISTDEIEFLSVYSYQGSEMYCVKYTSTSSPTKVKVSVPDLIAKGVTEEVINELFLNTRLMFKIRGRIFLSSSLLNTSLGVAADLSGKAIQEPSLARDAFIAERFFRNPKEVTMISRGKKVLALMSKTYLEIPQKILSDVLDEVGADMGTIKCYRYSVDHCFSSIYIEFPDKAREISKLYGLNDDFIPGLYLQTSGVGESSVLAKGTMRKEGFKHPVVYDEYSHKHAGNITKDDMLDGIRKRIFANYTLIPEKLCDLMVIPVSNPALTIKSVFKQIGIVNVIGKKNEMAVYEALCDEINHSMKYTAYDIAVNIMSIADRCEGLTNNCLKKLEKACKEAVFADYTTAPIKCPTVVLTA